MGQWFAIPALDKLVYDPYRRAYGRAADAWMHSHPNTTFNIYHNPGLVLEAQMSACVPCNIIAKFQSAGIFPYNSEIFCDDDFAPSAVSQRDPGVSQMVTLVENIEQSEETQTTQSVSVSVALARQKDVPGTSSNESNDHKTTLNSTDLTACSSKTSHFTNDVSRHPETLFCIVYIYPSFTRKRIVSLYFGRHALAWELPFPRCLGHLSST